jgi:hypothetical protein
MRIADKLGVLLREMTVASNVKVSTSRELALEKEQVQNEGRIEECRLLACGAV